MVDYTLALQATQPNPLAAYMQGVSARDAQSQIQQRREREDYFKEQGGGILRGDQSALEGMARFDPQGALRIQSGLAGEGRATAAAGRAQGAYDLSMKNAQVEEQRASLEQAIAMMTGANTPQQWDQLASEHAPDMVGQFGNRDSLIRGVIAARDGLPGVLARDASRAAGQSVTDFFSQGLGQTESGGRYDAVNAEGYSGKYQFGPERLADYNQATGQNVTMDQFVASPETQEAAQKWHVGDIDNFIDAKGLNDYLGETIGGVEITTNGMRAMAHLGGKEGMRKFLVSEGEYNPEDSNGTSLSDYARTHAGGQQPTQQGQPGQQPADMAALLAGKSPAEIASFMGNPNIPKEIKGLITKQLAKKPEKPADSYGRYVQEEEAAGRAPLSRIDFGLAMKGKGTTITTHPDGTTTISLDGGSGESPTLKESEAKASTYYSAMSVAMPTLEQFETQGLDWAQQHLGEAPLGLGEYFRTPEFSQYENAARTFINAQLRRESGAVISPSEFESAEKQYLPVPGNSPEVIAQKRRNRESAYRSMRLSAGPGADYLDQMAAARGKSDANPYTGMTDADFQALDIGSLTDEQMKQLAAARGVN